jgi:hypothetical protein
MHPLTPLMSLVVFVLKAFGCRVQTVLLALQPHNTPKQQTIKPARLVYESHHHPLFIFMAAAYWPPR